MIGSMPTDEVNIVVESRQATEDQTTLSKKLQALQVSDASSKPDKLNESDVSEDTTEAELYLNSSSSSTSGMCFACLEKLILSFLSLSLSLSLPLVSVSDERKER